MSRIEVDDLNGENYVFSDDYDDDQNWLYDVEEVKNKKMKLL